MFGQLNEYWIAVLIALVIAFIGFALFFGFQKSSQSETVGFLFCS